MPVMDGMQATRLIRSYEQHGYWDASVGEPGPDQTEICSDSQQGRDKGQCRKRIPIVAVSSYNI